MEQVIATSHPPSTYKPGLTLEVYKDERFQMQDGVYRFVMELDNAVLLLKRENTDGERTIPECDLTQMLSAGTACRLSKYSPKDENDAHRIRVTGDQLAPEEENTLRGIRARALWTAVRLFDDDPDATKGRKGLNKIIRKAQVELKERGIEVKITPSTLLRAINNCGSNGDRRLRYFLSQRGKYKSGRLPQRVEDFLVSAVNFFWNKRQRDFNDAMAYFRDLLKVENARRESLGLKPLKPPQRPETLRRRITLATSRENFVRKYSEHEARQKFDGVADSLSASRPGELILVDHTLLDDYLLLDRNTGLPLGRPWLSIAIDVATRCIPGFIITPEPPSLYTLVALLKRVNRDKSFLAEKYPFVEGRTDSWIKPTTVVVDNDWSHLSPSAQDAFADLGIEVIYAPKATPEFKAIVERMFHTLNTMLNHKLAGGISENVLVRRMTRFKPEDFTNMTLEDLEGLIYETLIVYENEPHEGVGGIPARLWAEGVRHGRPFIDNITEFDTLMAATSEISLTRSGVKFRNMSFHDQANTSALLNDLVALQPKKTQSDKTYVTGRVRAKIKYQPHDCSHIEVWNPVTKRYVSLFNRDEKYSNGLSFWAADRVRAFARQLDLAFTSDEQRWHARNMLRQHYEAFMPAQRVGTTREARRFVAQEQAALSGDTVVHTSAPATYAGNAEATNIPQDLAHQTRLDGDRVPDGVTRNPKKAAKTRRENQARKEKLAAIAAEAKNPAQPELDLPAPLILPAAAASSILKAVAVGFGAS